jgi:hypothetical protein
LGDVALLLARKTGLDPGSTPDFWECEKLDGSNTALSVIWARILDSRKPHCSLNPTASRAIDPE